MKIVKVESIPLSYATDDDPPTRRSFSVLKLVTDDGLVGWGEASDCYGHRHPLAVKALFEEDLQYALLGRDPRSPDSMMRDLRNRVHASLGFREIVTQALSAIEIALLDVACQAEDVSISELLGRQSEEIPVYAAGKPALSGTVQSHVDFLKPVLERGAKAAKIRPGRDLEWDKEFVREMRALLGDDLTLMVDGKYNYYPDSAIELAQVLGEIGAHAFEEPITDVDLDAVRRVAEGSPIPLAYGEHAFGEIDFRNLIERAGVRIVEPDVTVCGGILEARRIAALAADTGVELIPHVGGLTAIGFAANLHFASSLPEAPLFEYDARSYQPLRDDLVDTAPFAPSQLVEGRVPVPTGRGLGIEIDEAVLTRFPYVIDEELLSTSRSYGTPHI